MKFRIPVKRYVKDFYTQNPALFGDKGDVRKNSILGLWVMTVFAHPPSNSPLDYQFLEIPPLEEDQFKQEELILNLTFEIPMRLITDERVLLLSSLLESSMEFFAMGWIRGRLNAYPSEHAAAVEFMNEHKINDGHITADKFRMMHRRMNQKMRKPKSVQKT